MNFNKDKFNIINLNKMIFPVMKAFSAIGK